MDVCEEVADIAHVEISSIVRVLGTRSKPRVRSRTDGLAKPGQFSTDKKMPKSLSVTERPLLGKADIEMRTLDLAGSRGLNLAQGQGHSEGLAVTPQFICNPLLNHHNTLK